MRENVTPAAYTPESAGLPPIPLEPPRKPKRKLLIGLAVAAIVVGVGIGIAIVATDRTWDTFDKADKQLAVAIDKMDAAENTLDGLLSAKPAELAKRRANLASVQPTLDAADRELKSARERVRRVDDSTAKRAFIEAIDAAMAASKELRAGLGEALDAGDALAQLQAANEVFDRADTEHDRAFDLTDDAKWEAGTRSAKASVELYREVERRYTTMAGLWRDYDLDRAARVVALIRGQSEQILAAAEAGAADDRSAYNDAIDRYNEFGRRIRNVRIPEVLDDPNAVLKNLGTRLDAADEHLKQGERAYDRASKLLDDGDY